MVPIRDIFITGVYAADTAGVGKMTIHQTDEAKRYCKASGAFLAFFGQSLSGMDGLYSLYYFTSRIEAELWARTICGTVTETTLDTIWRATKLEGYPEVASVSGFDGGDGIG